MHKYPFFLASLACLCSLWFLGCAASKPSARYPVAHASVAHRLEMGTVVGTRDVVIDGTSSTMGMVLGAGVGAAVGAVAVPRKDTVTVVNNGDSIGIRSKSNSGQANAAVAIGSVVGAVAARHIEKKLTTVRAQELMIQLENGEVVVIVQERRVPEFSEGDAVQLYTTAMGNSRVFHADENPFVDPETRAYLTEEGAAEPEFAPVAW